MKKRRDLPGAEWDFSSCPRDELWECRAYEYARESDAVRRDVGSLRTAQPADFYQLAKVLRRPIETSSRVNAAFWYCPEFPEHPYLTIPSGERRQRLHHLGPSATSAVALKAKIIPPDIGQRLTAARVMYGPLELALFEVDWTESDTYLEAAFSKWLRENRPSEVEIWESRGAGNFVREWEDDLKALGAKRLLESTNSWADAFNISFEAIGRTRGTGLRKQCVGLYCDREEVWLKAQRRAKLIISAFERAYSSNRPD